VTKTAPVVDKHAFVTILAEELKALTNDEIYYMVAKVANKKGKQAKPALHEFIAQHHVASNWEENPLTLDPTTDESNGLINSTNFSPSRLKALGIRLGDLGSDPANGNAALKGPGRSKLNGFSYPDEVRDGLSGLAARMDGGS